MTARWKTSGRLLLAGAACLALGGCFMSPGKFVSELELYKNGTFAFSYAGQIQTVSLSKLAELGSKGEEFEAVCLDDDSLDERKCTDEEVAEQRDEWDARAEERAKEAEQMKMLLGGIDPTSPEAAGEIVERLQRQRGWKRVAYKGDGLFDVNFAITGTLGHDFAFPVLEKMPASAGFVTAILRKDNQVRVDAPGFAAQGTGNPMAQMMGSFGTLMQIMAMEEANGKTGRQPVGVDGTFTIVTDGRILANNTEEGPAAHSRGQSLNWTINIRTQQAPTALVAF